MNKIIIVGHPYSGHTEVKNLLAQCGMACPNPSRRDNLMPTEISQTLLKAHGAVPVEQLQTSQQLPQIKVAPIWQGMVLDLMLENLDQSLWGWADSDAIYLLDYWKEQDPQTVFVLVYDTPETVFVRAPLEQAAASEEELQRRIDAWVAYNAALLHFHLRNSSRSVLVHASQVQDSVKSTLNHISAHIKAPLQLPLSLLPAEVSEVLPHEQVATAQTDAIKRLTAKLQTMQGSQYKKERKRLRSQLNALQASVAVSKQVLTAMQGHDAETSSVQSYPYAEPEMPVQESLERDALAKLLVQQLLETHPQANQLYAELQAAATLAYDMEAESTRDANPALPSHTGLPAYQAWHSLVQQRLQLQAQTQLSKAQSEQIQRLQWQMEKVASAAQEKQHHLLEQLQQTLQSLENQQELVQQHEQAAEEKSQQLQTQLHQVQQELENTALQVRDKEAALAQLPKVKADLKVAEDKARALNEVGQENQMLLEQLHKVQEELENRYLKAQQQEKTLAELPKVKADLKAAQEKAVKLQQVEAKASQLSAELQVAQDMAKKLQPFQIQANKLQSHLKAAEAKTLQLQQSEAKLKKELQTELEKAPAAELKKENELLLLQLHKVQEELERYYLENNQFKANAKPSGPQSIYGAADRIKNEIPYRLGALMIKKSGSFSGVLSMPWALRAEEKRIRAEMAMSDGNQPALSEYKDNHEAKHVQRHLSYRLGNTWVKRTQSLGGWITLPVALYAETKAFRKERT